MPAVSFWAEALDTRTEPAAAAAPPQQGARAFAPFEWMLSRRYLRARRKEGFISVIAGFSFLGILLGVATLIVVMSVMNGFRKELIGKILGINGHIFVQAYDTPFTDYAAVADRINKVPGVVVAIPMVEGQALASTPMGSTGALVRGIRGADLEKIKPISSHIRQGSLDGFDQGGSLAVGIRLATQLNAHAGDSISLINPHGAATPMGRKPNIKAYPVNAVFEVGMSEFDSAFIYMPLEDAQAFFDKPGEATVIEVYVKDPDNIDGIKKDIEKAAGRQVILSDWRLRNRTFFGALAVERNVMFLILTLIVLVAALNIVSGLIMLVKDKSHDIAILRTMGATRGAIMRIFLITGASIGVVGTLGGCLIGVVFALNVETIRATFFPNTFPPELYFLSRLPSEVRVSDVTIIMGMSLTLSLLATLYPAWRAARLDPVEALRYE